MDVQKVDLANWPRREFWNHYMNEVRCTYAMTAELDASRLLPALKRRGLKLYPALIHMLSQVVHRHEEFRYNTGADGEPVLLRSLTPSYRSFTRTIRRFPIYGRLILPPFAPFMRRIWRISGNTAAFTALMASPACPETVFGFRRSRGSGLPGFI